MGAEATLEESLAGLGSAAIALVSALAGVIEADAAVPREMGDVYRMGR
jgi:hypothetical protein